jgi:hypothetical protein
MGSPLGVIATIGGLHIFSTTSGLGLNNFFVLYCFFVFSCLKIHRQNIPAIASDTAMIKNYDNLV